MATARLTQATARGSLSDSLSIMGPARKAREPATGAATVALSSSPVLASGDSGMLVRMRAVLHRHQCGSEHEAVGVCMRSARTAGQPPVAGSSCDRYINTLRFCEHATQHHNYPSFANAMMH